MLSVNTPHAGLRVYTSFLGGVGYDGLLFLFCMRLCGLRLCAIHLAMCVLCYDCCFFFSLCERIFLCCLRSFALARATSPFQSQRAGPQRFLVWVRVCWCCSPEHKKQNEHLKSSAFHKQNAKSPLRGRRTPQQFVVYSQNRFGF